MLGQFLVGSTASACNITIHALGMAAVVRVSNMTVGKQSWWPYLILIVTMIATVLVLMAAHTLEVIVWALIYLVADAAPADTNLVYFARETRPSATATLSRYSDGNNLAQLPP